MTEEYKANSKYLYGKLTDLLTILLSPEEVRQYTKKDYVEYILDDVGRGLFIGYMLGLGVMVEEFDLMFNDYVDNEAALIEENWEESNE